MKKFLSMLIAGTMLSAMTGISTYAAESVDYSAKLTELKSLIDQCEAKGIPTDYEQVSYATIERFEDYINQDIEKGMDTSYTDYEKACVDAIYSEAKTNLEAYIAGTKEALKVERPDMHNLTVNGSNIFYGEKPVFSIGYGFFGHAQADIPNFQKFGANNIQMEIGPHQTWGQGSTGWGGYTGVEGLNASANIVDDVELAHDGTHSLNFVFSDTAGDNKYIVKNRNIPCKPNTTYTYGCWSKGDTVSGAWMAFDWGARKYLSASSDWQENTFTYTTGDEATSMELMILVEDVTNVYLDDFFVYEEGSNINLVSNSGFESETYTAVEDLKIHLNNAQNNNVAVSLLLAPHYLTDIAAANGIELTTNSLASFIKYDINDTKAKEIIEAHIRGVLSNVTDYTCIDSICISNEPWFDTRWFSDAYNQKFRDFLVEKHGSLDGIKSAHNKSYAGLNYITMPKIDDDSFLGFNDVDALAYDWMEFNDKVLTDWHKWMADIVDDYFPGTPVHSKVMENIIYNGETNERVELARGTDYDMFGEFSGYSGIDGSNYSESEYYEMMFLYDYLQSSVGKPVYNSETHIIKDYDGSVDELSAANTKDALYRMWQGAIHGRSMSTVWAWQRHYADDANNSSFFGSLLFRPDLVAGLGKMNLDFARLSDEIAELQKNSNKVAIFYSKPSRMYTASHVTKVLDVYKEVVKNGYDVGVVTENSIGKLPEYNTLIIPDVTHTTPEALAAVESFIASGRKVLYTSEDVFSKDQYEKSQSNANIISGGKTYSVSALSANAVTLKDASGAALTDVEWQYSVTGDRILVNAVNTSGAAKNIEVYYNGEKLTNLKELIAEEDGLTNVTLNQYEPQFIECTLYECTPNDVLGLEVDSVNNKITWKAVGENVGSVTVYKCEADKTVTYQGNTTGKEYVYSGDGTYIVCPVLKDGTELEGKVITVPSNISIDVIRNNKNVKVELTNNGTNFVRAKILVEAYKDGDIVSYGYSKGFITPGVKSIMNMSLSTPMDVDNLVVTVYDDINNILAQATK